MSGRESRPGPELAFPGRLRRLRTERGWTQAELAERCRIEPYMISKYERGLHLPSVSNLRRLANTLELSLEALVRDEPRWGYLHVAPELRPLCLGMARLPEVRRQLCLSLIHGMAERASKAPEDR